MEKSRLCSNVFKTNNLCFRSQLLLQSEKLQNDNAHFFFLIMTYLRVYNVPAFAWSEVVKKKNIYFVPSVCHCIGPFHNTHLCNATCDVHCTFKFFLRFFYLYRFSCVCYNWIFFCETNNGESDKMNDISVCFFLNLLLYNNVKLLKLDFSSYMQNIYLLWVTEIFFSNKILADVWRL